jgi:predicted transcriptional regulator
VLGDYEINETETIEVHTIDKQIQKYIRGITKRLKAEIILEEQYPDKRIAIAKLLVEKKMKITEIARIMGYSKRHTLRIIEELVNTGIIKRVARGKYEWAKRQPPKQHIIESRQMTLQQTIEFVKEKKAKITHDTGTLVVEYEDDYAIRRVIISSIIVEDSRVVERLAGSTTIYKIPRIKLRQLLNSMS